MADPKYGASSAGFQEALARTLVVAESLEKALDRLTGTEAANTSGVRANAAARVEQAGAMGRQLAAIDGFAGALQRETSALAANAAAWRTNAEARAATTAVSAGDIAAAQATARTTTKGSRFGGSGAGFGTLDLAGADARLAAEQAARERSYASRLGAGGATPGFAFVPDDPALRAVPAPGKLGTPFQGPPLALPSGPTFIAGPGGVEATSPGRSPVPSAPSAEPVRAYTKAEEEALGINRELAASLGTLGAQQAAVNDLYGRSVAAYSASSNALLRHGALSTEFIQALARGEVTVRDFGNSMVTTIGKFAGWAVAGGLVYGAYDALKKFGEGAANTQAGVAQLERALPNVNKSQAAEGFRKESASLNVSIREVADAQFYAARGFRDQAESLEVARTALLAYKLDSVDTQTAIKAFSALSIAFHLNAKGIAQVFNELDVGQLKFNARLNQTLPLVGRAAPSFANAGGSSPELSEQIIQLVRTTGGGGGTGGGNPSTFLIREPANLRRGNAEQVLREFGISPEWAQKNVGAFNRYVQSIAPNLSDTELGTLAQAAGGGAALGRRYALPLFQAGRGTLPAEVHEATQTAAKAAQEDLEHKLNEIGEQFKGINVQFEQIGSIIGEAGLVSALEQFAGAVKLAGRVTADALKPLTLVGHAVGQLPGGVQDLLLLGAAGLGAAKIGTTGFGLNARAIGAKALPGYLQTGTASDILDAQSTARGDVEFLENERRGASVAARRAAGRATRAQRQAEADAAALPAGALEPTKVTPEAERAIESKKRAKNARLAAEEKAEAEQELTAEQRTAEDRYKKTRTLGTRSGLEAYNASFGGAGYVAERSAGANTGPIRGAGATTDLAAAARQGAVADTEAVTQVASWKATTVAAMRRVNAEMGSFVTSAGNAVKGAKDASVEAENVAGTTLTAKLGSVFTGLGGKLMGGLTTAFIGAAAASLLGEIVGGKGQGAVTSIGTNVAYGAGLGSLLGPSGAAAGAAVGAAVGLGQTAHPHSNLGTFKNTVYSAGEFYEGIPVVGQGFKELEELFGEETFQEERFKEEAAKRRTERKKVIAELHKALPFGARRSKVSYVNNELKTGEVSLSELAAQGREEAPELKEIYDSSVNEEKKGEKTKIIEERNKSLEASSKFFKGTPRGRKAVRELAEEVASNIKALKDDEENVAQVVGQATKDTQAVLSSIQEEFKDSLAQSHTRRERNAAHQTFANQTQAVYEALGQPRDQEVARLGKLKEETGSLELSLRLAPAGSTRTALQADLERKRAEIARVTLTINELNAGIAALLPGLREIAAAASKTIYDANIGKINTDLLRAEAQVGNNPQALAKLRQKAAGERNREAKNAPGTPEEAAKIQAEALKGITDTREEGFKTQLEHLDAEGKKAEAQVPAGQATQRAVVHAREVQRRAAFIKAHSQNPSEILGAEAEAADAARGAAEAGHSEAAQIAQTEGQIAQAHDIGNAVQQARDAQATAARLAALAQNPAEALQAQLAAVQAYNQLQQALAGRIKLQGEYADSLVLNPLERDKKDISTQRKILGVAQGPEGKLKAQTDLNNLIKKYHEDKVTEADEVIQFELGTNRINSTTAVERWQKILREGHLTKQRERDLRTKIFQAQQSNAQDFAVGYIGEAPSLYAAATLTKARQAAAPLAGASYDTIHHTPNLHQHNTIQVNVTGARPGELVAEMERVFGSLTRAQLRSAGLS